MASLRLRALDSGFLELYTLVWWAETAGADDAAVSMALVLLLRQSGFLLALPYGAIPQEELQAAVAQGESVLGPHHVFTGFRDDGAEQEEDEQEVEVLVVDMSTAVLPALSRYSEVDGATLCFSDDPAILPSPEPLLVMVRQWLLVKASAKAAFCSTLQRSKTTRRRNHLHHFVINGGPQWLLHISKGWITSKAVVPTS